MSDFTPTDAWHVARYEWQGLDIDREALIEAGHDDIPDDPGGVPGWLEERPELLKSVRSFGPEDLEGPAPGGPPLQRHLLTADQLLTTEASTRRAGCPRRIGP